MSEGRWTGCFSVCHAERGRYGSVATDSDALMTVVEEDSDVVD